MKDGAKVAFTIHFEQAAQLFASLRQKPVKCEGEVIRQFRTYVQISVTKIGKQETNNALPLWLNKSKIKERKF